MVWLGKTDKRYDRRAKLCHMDTENFILYIKTCDFYNHFAKDGQTLFDTLNYKLDRYCLKKKKINWIKLGGKIMTKFVVIRAKSYSYLTDDGSDYKKVKGPKSES